MNFKKKHIILFLIGIPLFFTSCEKEGYGNYIISFNNYTSDDYYVTAYLDGATQGSFMIHASQSVSWSYSSPCDDLVESTGMENVRVFTYVPSGEHTLEIITTSTNFVMTTHKFTQKADGCSHQSFIID
jgi:hypothetical protein